MLAHPVVVRGIIFCQLAIVAPFFGRWLQMISWPFGHVVRQMPSATKAGTDVNTARQVLAQGMRAKLSIETQG